MAECHLIVAIEHHAGESLLSFGCFLAACSAGHEAATEVLIGGIATH
ncbi:hypothetical protein [Rhizobium giardinii]|uniref:Uncharacterized protein n=1 Tax=Rhizobium giardinii TaxID=56731 RepID=A0A7W8UEL1_9HYPH|nr:hypothetical protein [Rhizobium giardinii]